MVSGNGTLLYGTTRPRFGQRLHVCRWRQPRRSEHPDQPVRVLVMDKILPGRR
jgi:hypothetical protein